MASPLPSVTSSAGRLALFGDFVSTTELSDFLESCIIDVHLSLPDTVRGPISRERLQDLPVPTHGVSERAQGLRRRGVLGRLAIATSQMWPSGHSYGVGTPKQGSYAAEYLARPYLGRRFGDALTDVTARLEAGVGRSPFTV